MLYKCVYCKAQYEHDKSYSHNSYQCPKRKGLKASITAVLVLSMLGLTGCEAIKSLLPKSTLPDNVDRAELVVYIGEKSYKYVCSLSEDKKSLADCVEVQ